MKYHFSLLLSLCFFLLIGRSESVAQTNPIKDWDMKTYYMVILKIGPFRDQDSTETEKIQEAHLANMGKMYDAGKLALAGPFTDDSSLAGIFILNVQTLEEAEKIASEDPEVIAGRLIYEIHPWFGPSTLHF